MDVIAAQVVEHRVAAYNEIKEKERDEKRLADELRSINAAHDNEEKEVASKIIYTLYFHHYEK